MRRLLALALLALPLPLAAQRAGLLLGLRSDSGYRTLWIAPVDGRLVVAAARPRIVVPRADGFWTVDVVYGCSVQWREPFGGRDEGGPDSIAYLDTHAEVVRVPLGAPIPRDSAGPSCAEASRIVYGQREDADESGECHISSRRLTHVSPRLISVYGEYRTTEFCEPGRYTFSRHNAVSAWESDEPVSLLAHLAPARAKAVTARFEREKGECALEHGPDEAWGIVREPGGWRATFVTSGATACRGDSGGDPTVSVAVPGTLARRDAVDPWLRRVRAAHPTAHDLFTSPAGDLVAALVGQDLLVFVPRGSTLGPAVLTVRLRPDDRVVMAEWATGSHVDRWTRTLGAAP